MLVRISQSPAPQGTASHRLGFDQQLRPIGRTTVKIHVYPCAALAFIASLGVGAAADLAMPRKDLLSPLAGVWGVDLRDQNRSIRPGDNFYEYQNGKWLASVQFG